jgi:hypothetical protein
LQHRPRVKEPIYLVCQDGGEFEVAVQLRPLQAAGQVGQVTVTLTKIHDGPPNMRNAPNRTG